MESQLPKGQHILVPLDGSPLAEQAIPYALSLIAPGGAITLLRVIPRPEPIHDPLGGILMSEQEVLGRYRVMAGQEAVNARERWKDETRATIDVMIEVGDPADEIMRCARERDAVMIVMASKGRGAFGRLALGSVADRIARASDVPVVVIRPEDALPDMSRPLLRRLVVPLDGSERSLAAIPVAIDLARQLHASIKLVTIVDFGKAAPPALAYGAAFSQELYDEIMAGVEGEARLMLDEVGGQLLEAGVSTSWEVLTGPPAEAIIEIAAPADLIVLTSHGRGGFKRWLLGSVAEKLVRHSPVPVVIVPARLAAQPVEQRTAAPRVVPAPEPKPRQVPRHLPVQI